MSGVKYMGMNYYEGISTLLNKRLNFVDCYSLKHSIPRKWRSRFKDKLHEYKIEQHAITNLLKLQKTCRGVYQTFLKKLQVTRPHKKMGIGFKGGFH